MVATIQINERGSLTLPKALRKRLGLDKGGVVMAESLDEGILLKPAMAFPVEIYSDDRIAHFDSVFRLSLHWRGADRLSLDGPGQLPRLMLCCQNRCDDQ